MPFLVLLSLGGCEGLDDRSAYLTGPDAIEWTNYATHVVSAHDGMRGGVSLSDGVLHATLSGYPPGTQLQLGDELATADAQGDAHVEIPVSPLYGGVPTADMRDAPLDGLLVTIQPPGGDPIPLTVPTQRLRRMPDHLASVVDGPIRYTGEGPDDGPAHTAYWHAGGDALFVGAPAATLADIDVIAVHTQTEVGITLCDGYLNDNGTERDLDMAHMETTVSVYGRRSGALLRTRTFAPIERCPPSLTLKDHTVTIASPLQTEAVRAWLAELLDAWDAGVPSAD